jgi:hypothetical protein
VTQPEVFWLTVEGHELDEPLVRKSDYDKLEEQLEVYKRALQAIEAGPRLFSRKAGGQWTEPHEVLQNIAHAALEEEGDHGPGTTCYPDDALAEGRLAEEEA